MPWLLVLRREWAACLVNREARKNTRAFLTTSKCCSRPAGQMCVGFVMLKRKYRNSAPFSSLIMADKFQRWMREYIDIIRLKTVVNTLAISTAKKHVSLASSVFALHWKSSNQMSMSILGFKAIAKLTIQKQEPEKLTTKNMITKVFGNFYEMGESRAGIDRIVQVTTQELFHFDVFRSWNKTYRRLHLTAAMSFLLVSISLDDT